MSLKLVVFDIAGTTVTDENFVATAFRNAFGKHNIHIADEEVNPLMGYEKKLAIQRMLEQYGVAYDAEKIDAIYQDFVSAMIEFYEYSSAVQAAPGAEDLFQQLKERSVSIALNTGFPRNIADVIVRRFQWLEKGLVDDFIASDEVQQGRPYPYMIEQLMRRAGVDDPSQVAKVGDTTVDIEEGRNARCRYNIAITTGACGTAELKREGPTHIVDSLKEISYIL